MRPHIVRIYIYLLLLGIFLVLAASAYYIVQPTTNRVLKFAIVWFAILMIANIINMMATLNYYKNNAFKRGSKGPGGYKGPKGFRGKGQQCGAICGAAGKETCTENEKSQNGGKCPKIMTTHNDGSGNSVLNDPKLRIGPCIFPFVYNYVNQYDCIGEDSIDYNYSLKDPNAPKNPGSEGWCATSLNSDKTVKTYGYCDKSGRETALNRHAEERSMAHQERLNKQKGILDLSIIHGNRSSIQCPVGYSKIDKDLNEGTGGAYVYLCKKTGLGPRGVSSIGISKNQGRCNEIIKSLDDKPMKVRTLNTDLNKDTNVDDSNPVKLNLCLGLSNSDYIKDIHLSNSSNLENDATFDKEKKDKSDPQNYKFIDQNLNEGTDGSPIYIHYSSVSPYINPINTAFVYQKNLYFIEGEYYYIYDRKTQSILPGKLVVEKFGKLPRNLSGAFTYNNSGNTYFFSGSYAYLYDDKNRTITVGYPKPIRNVFRGIPNNIDAAFTWNKDNTTYFFKDKYYYKFNSRTKNVERGYPRLINARWPGAPPNIDAVFSYNGKTYFIRGNKYYVLGSDERVANSGPLNSLFSGLTTNILAQIPTTPSAGTTSAGTTSAGTTSAGTTSAGTTSAGTTSAGTTRAGTT